MLWGFCFTTQGEQRFNQSWACAFHTSWYTDESHPMWDVLDDPGKRREIRYGNNICVLFRALLHCRRFYGQDTLWQAVARGFNTSSTIARVTAEILTEARRVQRDKPSKDVSDTARAADDWIEFLDSWDPHTRPLPTSELYSAADAFFKDQGKRLLNAARVPINGRSSFSVGRQPPRGASDEANLSPRLPTSPSVKYENHRELADRHWPAHHSRKRSPSPPRDDRSPKSRRYNSDSRQQSRIEPDRHGALDQLPTIQATKSPRRLDHPQLNQPSQPSQPVRPASYASAPEKRVEASNAPAQSTRPELHISQPSAQSKTAQVPQSPAKPGWPEQPMPQASAPARTQEAHNASTSAARPQPAPQSSALPRKEEVPSDPRQAAVDDRSALQARIASLEKELAVTKGKLGAPPTPTTATTHPPSQLREDIGGLKRDMATVTNVVGTMMESMHAIVDSLNSLQDEVVALSSEPKTPSAQPQPTIPDLSTVLSPLQTLTTTVNTLRAEVSQLKAQPPATDSTNNITTTTDTTALQTLLHAQTTRIDKLSHQLSQLQATQAQILRRSHSPTTGAATSGVGQQPHAQPQTLRQAMAAAERDMRHHLATVQHLYHRPGGAEVSRALTEKTADFLAE